MLESGCFRITRDADLNIDEEDARDLVIEVERQLKKRQRGQAVRLEYQSGTSRFMRRFMSQETKLRDEDMYEINGPIDITMIFDFYNIKGYDKLRYTQAYPHTPWSILKVDSYDKKSIFEIIRKKDLLIHLPYESFEDSVVRFVSEAANDENVLAIKQTLYRVSSSSAIIQVSILVVLAG